MPKTKTATTKTISDRALGRLLREVYQQACWDASGLSTSDEEARTMKWDKIARAARKALRKRSS